jgi:hypothetical protein
MLLANKPPLRGLDGPPISMNEIHCDIVHKQYLLKIFGGPFKLLNNFLKKFSRKGGKNDVRRIFAF